MKPGLLLVVTCSVALLATTPASGRKWSDASGKFSVEAELVQVKDGKAILKTVDGARVTVPVARLSAADRAYLKSGDDSPATPGVAPDAKINALLKKVHTQFDVPAISGAIVTSQGLVAYGVTGVRKRGAKARATPNDLWHLGSDTKAMTATLVARLVEQKKVKWDTTLGEVFAGDGFNIQPDFRGVTLLQLLSHHAGLPANLELANYWGADGSRERLRAVREELAKAPASAPGSQFAYSNLGYIIAGAAVEKVTGKSWERNMVEHVFGPLEMKSAGFGGTGTPGKLDQPWPHAADGQPEPENGPGVDNPPVMGPPGRVHCTIQDWSKYLADFLRGMSGKPALLPAAAYQTLSTPTFGGDYALGWIVTQRDWGGGTVLTHGGSNTMNYAIVWVAPARDFAVLACTNQGGDVGQQACNAAVVALLGHHGAIPSE
jgi:CubicO group peptidase (beta-lactamase class C family)